MERINVKKIITELQNEHIEEKIATCEKNIKYWQKRKKEYRKKQKQANKIEKPKVSVLR